MAANLAGMFSQINNAIQANPTAEVFGNLLGNVSQGAGNMLGSAVGMPERSMDFMNQTGRNQEADKQLRGLDMSTVQGMQQASKLLMAKGDPVQSQRFQIMAEQKKQQERLQLEKDQEKLRQTNARSKAAGLAMQRGDKTEHQALVGGFLEPEEYIANVLDEEEGFTLSPEQIRFDAEGNEIARGAPKTFDPTKGGPGGASVFIEKEVAKYTDAARSNELNAANADMLATEFDQIADQWYQGGKIGTAKDALLRVAGTPDKVSDLKIKYYRLRNTDVVKNLPPGSASDADVLMAKQSWPGDDASMKQMSSFLRGMKKMEDLAFEYNNFMADYIGETGTNLGANKVWREYKAQESAEETSFNSLEK